jgi:hypothetical protein
MRKIYFLLLSVLFFSTLSAQNVEVSTGGSPTNYTTLKAAFDAVNAGTHTGSILIEIASNTSETAPAVLNSSGAGSASYTAVVIRPSVDGVTISGATTTGRGLIELSGADNVTLDGDNPNTSGTNQNLTITNTAATTVTYCVAVRIAVSTTNVPSADNNTIKNCIINGNATNGNISTSTSNTGMSNASFGIYVGGYGAATSTGAPAAIASVTTNTTTGSCSANNTVISNNSISQCGRGIVFNGSAATFSTGITITNNTIGSSTALTGTPPYTSPASTVYTKGIWVAGATAVTITGNTLRSIVSYVATTTNGIELNAAVGAGGVTISNNTITGVVCNTTSSVYGIQVLSSLSNPVISNNTITGIQAIGSAGTGTVGGIALSHTGTAATVSNNIISTVYQRTASGYPAIGINIVAGNAITIQNNFISDINAPMNNAALTTQYGTWGIRITAGLNHRVYHNSVNLSGALLAGSSTFSSSAALVITANTLTGIDVRNNIFSNTLTGAPAGSSVTAIMLPTGTSAMNLTLNNNAYYEGTGTGAGIAQIGTTSGSGLYLAANFSSTSSSSTTNLRNYTTGYTVAGDNDNGSLAFSTAAPFTSSTNLHINVGTTPTQLESSGAAVGVTTDIDGQVRPGPAGSVNGAGFAPDMGADEFDGVFLDVTPPAIAYTPLSFTCGTGNRTLVATITDLSGIPTSGLGLPVLYWKINSGSYSAVTATSLGANQYSFTFGAGTTLGDVVSYYIVAQDNAATPNVGVSPATGAAGFTTNPPAASTPPTTPNTYSINSTMSGIYTVGATGTYPTLTAAVADYNAKCLTGPVTFSLIDASYSASETFPITIYPNATASSTNTLTIKPAAGVSPVISGLAATNFPLVLFGADYVILDGSNTVGGTTRDLTIKNTNTATNGVATIFIVSQGVGGGATNNTIKNCIIEGPAPGTSSLLGFGIYVGGNGTANGPDNDNLIIQNNQIRKAYYGIQAVGAAGYANDGLVIKDNTFGSGTATEYLGKSGAVLGYADGAQFNGNTISNIIGTNNNLTGLFLSTGFINSTVNGNTIRGLQYTGTGGYAGKGIEVVTGSATSNLTISNNMISDIRGDGWSSLIGDAIVGIRIGATSALTYTVGGVKLYNNSVNLGHGSYAGNSSGTISAALYLSSTTSDLDIRNNTFSTNLVNSGAAAAKSYSIYSAAANTAFTNINYNNYSVSGAQGVLGYLGADQTTLAGIQTAFGQNASSVNATPSFVAADNLHLTNALGNNLCLNGAATPITGLTTDIDGDTRNATTPDIGADEFNPTLPTFLVTNQSACFGQTVNLTASGVTAGSTAGQTFTYFTDAALTTPVADATAVGAGTYYIKATYTSGGCSIDQVQTVVVTINALPTVSIAVTETSGSTANDGSICAGASATLTASGATSYVWSTTATTAAITVSPATTTSYTVTGTDANGCQNTASTTITVNALPVPSITVAETSGTTNNDGTICAGASVSLTATGGTSYSWSDGSTTAAITVSPTATTTYTVTVTDGNGCSATSNTTITVNAIPTTYNVTGGGAYCSGGVGSAVGFSNSEVGVNYQLVLNGTNVGSSVSGTGSAISFGLQTAAGTYTVVATNATTACTDNMTGSVTVSINALPTITPTLTQPTTCATNDGGAALTLGGAAGPYTFNWTGLGSVQGQQDQTTLYTGTYSVIVTAVNGCQASSSFTLIGPGGCSVCPTVAAVSTTPAAICQGGTATLSATGLVDMGVSYGVGFVVSATPLANPYTGTIVATVANGSLTNGGSTATSTYAFNTPGTQYVYAILSPAPADPACRPFQTTQINVVATPDVNAVANQTVCSGAATTAVAFSGTVPGTVYTWTNNTTSIGLAASGTGNIPSFTATNFTNAPVTATVTVTPNNPVLTQASQTFNYTGAAQAWTVPAGVTSIDVEAKGAQGGRVDLSGYWSPCCLDGGLGGKVQSKLAVTPGQVLNIYVGGIGNTNGTGGYNGGGTAAPKAFINVGGGGGGGATDIRIGGTALSNRVIVAGAGGGAGGDGGPTAGGVGGGLIGGAPGTPNNVSTLLATGGTQTAGGTGGSLVGFSTSGNGSLGLGGVNLSADAINSGGGAGYYGGGGGTWAGGAGGSSYTDPTLCSNVTHVQGATTGDGSLTISYNIATSVTCPGPSKTFTITVNPTPTLNTVTNVAACSGATVSVPFSGFVPGTVYEWTNSNTSIGLAASGTGDLSFTGTNAGTAAISSTTIVTPKFTNNGVTCTGTPVAFTITINPTPTVNAVASETLCSGSATTAVAFSGAVTGTVYNWTNNTPSIGLAASGSGNIASFAAVNTGTAPVVATITVTPSYTNGGATCTGTPTTYTITVNPSGQVNTVANQTICNNANTAAVTFGTANTGGTTTYSWTNDNTSIGLAASGTGDIASFVGVNTGTAPVTATITVTPTFTSGSGVQQFSGSISAAGPNMSARMNRFANTTTCSNVTSFPGIFATEPYPYTSYTYTNNTGSTQCVSATLTATAGNLFMAAYSSSFDPADIATNYLADAGSSSTGPGAPTTMSFNVPSGTTYVLVLHSVNQGQAGTYNLSLSPVPVSCSGTPRTFTITVNPTPTVNAVSNEVVCNGANTTAVSFSGAVTGTVYNWTNSNTSIGLAASGSGNIASFAAVNTGNTPVTATVTVTPSYTNGGVTCTGTPTSYTITVNPTPTVNTVANQAVCNGSNTTAVTFSGAVTGTVYSWTNNTPSIGLAASGTGDIASFTAVNTGTTPVVATITVTPSANGCSGTPRTFTITVNPTPTVNAVSNQVICNGSNTTAVAFSGAVTGTVYSWTNNTTSIGLAASGTGNIASFAAVNTGTTPVTATITVTPSYTNGGVTCTGTPTSFTITVNPTPTVNVVANQVLCNGSNTTAVTFTGAVAGTVYNWTNNTTSIGLAASGTGNIASFVGVNAGTAPVVATITVTPSFTSGGVTCTGTPRTFTITVNPTPTVNAVSNQVVCNRSTTTAVAFSGAVTGTVYNWTNNTPSIGLAASGTGDIAAFTAVNTTQTPVVATITVTPSYTNGGVTCLGTPRTFTITVNPTPIVSATDLFNQRICISDGPVALNATPVGGTWSGIGVSGFNFIPSATAVGNFILTYRYTNQYGCTTTDTTTAKVSACDERNISLASGGAVLFPNPNGGQFNIRVNSTRFQYLQMRIYNQLGQLISTKQWSGLVYGQILPVNMNHLPAAVYTVRIIYDGGNLYEDRGYKMIIQH